MRHLKNKTLFLVTSALETPNGNMEPRFFDTLSTINSINSQYRNCEIWLIETGFKKPDQKYLDMLPDNVVVKGFWQDERILQIIKEAVKYSDEVSAIYGVEFAKVLYLLYVKNVTESWALSRVLREDLTDGWDRIFKLSGRYCLQPRFNVEDHSAPKFVVSNRVKSIQRNIPDIDWVHYCFLWSAPGSDYKKLIDLWNAIELEVQTRVSENKLIDIEHALYLHLDRDWVQEIDKLNVYAKINGTGIVFK